VCGSNTKKGKAEMKMRELGGYIGVILALALTQAAIADDMWLTDFQKAKQMAAETKRPILADFSGSDWCGWCIKLDKEVFSQKAFADYAKENLVLFMADYPQAKQQSTEIKKQNGELAMKYGIQGYPTVLLLDAKGEVIGRTGYQPGGAEKYVAHLQELLKAGQKAVPSPDSGT
jgi:protein disulfide-isomerase